MNSTMTKIAAALILTAVVTGVQAAPVATSSAVLLGVVGAGLDTAAVMPGGGPITSDSNLSGFVDYATGTWGVSSTNSYLGQTWTATNGKLITTAGSYALDTTTGVVTTGTGPVANDGIMYFTIGAGQVAGTIDFNWGSYDNNIRIVDVWNLSTIGGNTLYTSALVPGEENGPFPGYNLNFSMAVPVPEASSYSMFLVGLGLVGVMARRRSISFKPSQ